MASRRPYIPQRTPVFLACEGGSEYGYVRWLNRLARNCGALVAIKAERLQGGDPLELVESAMSKLRHRDRPGARFEVRGLLLDADLRGVNPGRDSEAARLAERRKIRLIWQEPIHEAFLLRHFDGFETHRPPDKRSAQRQLKNVWPDYEKGMDATGYERRLGLDHLRRVRTVEPVFDAFLALAGWL